MRSVIHAASQLSGRGPTDVDVAPVPACTDVDVAPVPACTDVDVAPVPAC